MTGISFRNPVQKSADLIFLRRLFQKHPQYCVGVTQKDMIPRQAYDRFIADLRRRNPDVFIYDPVPLFCKDGTCKVRDGEFLVYGDEGHLSNYGAQLLVNDLIKQLGPKVAI